MNITEELNNFESIKLVTTNNGCYSNGLLKKPSKPIGHLYHKPTNTHISVYHKINRFHRFFIKICFGMEYVEN